MQISAFDDGGGALFKRLRAGAKPVEPLLRGDRQVLSSGGGGKAAHGPRRKGDVYRIALDNTRARQELGWEPRISLEEGLSLTVDYFREQVASPR